MLPSLAQCAERCEPIPILHEKREAIDIRKRAALADSLVEIVAAEILHHDVDQIVVFVDLVDGDKVFVVDALLR